MSSLRTLGKIFKKTVYYPIGRVHGPAHENVDVQDILMGGEGDIRAKRYAALTGDFMRPSRSVYLGPHYKLLAAIEKEGMSFIDSEGFKSCDYFKNARDCIRIFGDYFPYVKKVEDIALCAKRFATWFNGERCDAYSSDGHSTENSPIVLAPILHSDKFELIQGNHRVAAAAFRSQDVVRALILKESDTTPLQDLIANVMWDGGERCLYQPIESPELNSEYTLLRKCTDRLDRMLEFLGSRKLSNKECKVLDLGAYYGWFVSELRKRGYRAIGVERDPIAIQCGLRAYGNLDGAMHWDDASFYLAENKSCHDVVLCLSIMHHLFTGRVELDAVEFLQKIDRATSKVLFFEMAQEHEDWFSAALRGWDESRIANWVLSNSSFKEAIKLGRDEDGKGKFVGNFGRTLFAFCK